MIGFCLSFFKNSIKFIGKSAMDALEKQDPQQVTPEEWRKVLTPLEYSVAREGGTERPFSGKFDKHFESGLYVCRCCGAQLFKYIFYHKSLAIKENLFYKGVVSFNFRSDAKFNSGCGWPAFSKSVDNDLNIVRLRDTSMGMERVEVRCKQVNMSFHKARHYSRSFI